MADIVTSRIFQDGEKGITATKLNDVIGSSVIQTAFYSAKPTASTADPADTLLLLKAAGSYAQIPFSAVTTSVAGQLPSSDPEIWSVRLRSFNAVGNPNFEVDQRNIGDLVAIPGGNNFTFALDRWSHTKTTSTMAYTSQSGAVGTVLVSVPGTSFSITRSSLVFTLTTQQPSLAAGDLSMVLQTVEGLNLRELISDVHSISILASTNVAGGLKFALSLRDPLTTTKSLCKLCTLSAPNVWQLITLPNLPIMPSGNFSVLPGNPGYLLGICLAAGSTYMPPANDTWQNGNFTGAIGMDNLGAKPVGSYLILGFIQHEPGAVCSTLMDKPFSQNLNECMRYYQKTYDYGVLPGAVNDGGSLFATAVSSWHPYSSFPFKCNLARLPTALIGYSPTTGVSSAVRDTSANIDRTISGNVGAGESGFGGFAVTTQNDSPAVYQLHYIADTGF